MTKKINDYFLRIVNWLGKRNWEVISGILFFIAFFEIFELLHKDEPFFDPFHLIEFILYVVILTFMGILISFYIKINNAQKHTMEILDYKHNISMELASLEDWEILTDKICRIPGNIAAVDASRLCIHNPIFGQLETAATWNAEDSNKSDLLYDCQECLEKRVNAESLFSLCQYDSTSPRLENQAQQYCLPLAYANRLLALLQFKLKPGEKLSDKQVEKFENIQYEMALALRASYEHKKNLEIQQTEIALAERHSLSTYLHDNLSQNLAYLCLKLDQFKAEEELLSLKNEQKEIKRMKDAANQAYDIVRGMIETIHPDTTPNFVNLIRAYAKKVSQRADIKIQVNITGKEVFVDPEVQQAIFYIYQEILSNVEKHSEAKNARVLIKWDEDNVNVTVSDDGVGFDPQQIDRTKHFGMEIVQERIDKIDGRIEIYSSIDSGTEVTIIVPVFSN